ncbi:hypothetical protein LCGC14_2011690 [marine sediment metagenome]|uniref:Uncharacterized protein n=1 Tax=marine sediment metagenome TaxID=412755 RepID=A0A0F9F0D1_9ZZZZ
MCQLLRAELLCRLCAAVSHSDEDVPPGRLRKAELHLLQDRVRTGLRKQDDQLRQLRPRDRVSRFLLHGLQAGLGDQEREICYTVCKPVWETKTKVCSGHWETREIAPRACEPAACEPEACCPVRQCRVWVPEIIEKQIECTKYVRETCVKKVPYTVCRMVRENRVKTCTYKVCKMVPEQRTRTCTYKVCRMVRENRVKTCTYKVCRIVTECRTKEIPYKVCKMVPETCTKRVAYTVCKPVHYQRTINCVRMVPKRVPYTVTRCVRKVICKQVPVKVCCPVPCEPKCCEAPKACEPTDRGC